MDYTILDSAGNALASFADDELAARATLHAMVAVEPEAADHVALLAYGDDGMPIGEAMTVYDIPPAVIVAESDFVQAHMTASLVRRVSRHQRRYLRGLAPIAELRVFESTPERKPSRR
jgi:hypothetical protein